MDENKVVSSGYCMTCRNRVGFKTPPVLKSFSTSRGVKYSYSGFCVFGHKMSVMTKKPDNL